VSRSFPPVALAIGVLYAVVGALQLAFDQATVFASASDYVIEWLFVAALALTIGLFARAARTSEDRLTAVAWTIAAAGQTAMGVAALVTAVAGRESLDVVFPLGVLLTLVGLVVLAVQDVRRRVQPSRLSIPADVLVGAGSLALAAGWLAVARLAASDRELAPAA
jgi:hypothetical protein